MEYIECLFIGPGEKAKPSALKNNLIHSVESALVHVEMRLEQGLSRLLIVAVNDHPGLDQLANPNFCVARFLEQASTRWTPDHVDC